MPVYDYLCPECGPVSALRPMSESDLPYVCPDCNSQASRAILYAPNITSLSAHVRDAHYRNEKSQHEPKFSTKDERAEKKHPAGCSCCSSGEKKNRTLYTADGSKMFPSGRPWMISH